MKARNMRLSAVLLGFVMLAPTLGAQTVETHTSKDGRFTYRSVANDPLKTRIYTLKNGLTVMLSVNKSEPRLQTLIATRAGSKNDPATATGLAHYLEHMLFKGTDRFGSKDWEKEKGLLAEIERLYEEYNHTTDAARRTEIYHRIDSVSGVAATYAIANEYDKMMGSIGAKGTNAFTWHEQTVYMEDVPSNQIDTWLAIEAERFRNPVFRLFHTELEAVYEEKNISLDDDADRVMDAAMASMFRNHAYGTQTTIGTVEHLKNPSLKEIRKYYETYYVPNNMAIIMAGDFDPDRVIEQIDKHFGSMKSKPVPAYTFAPEKSRSAPDEITVVGPEAENVLIGFRFPGTGTREALLLEATDLLLAYKSAGLIDLNLNKQQVVQSAGSYTQLLKDYSTHFLSGAPKQGQSLTEVRDLLLAQIEKIKRGEFDEVSMKAAIKNQKVDLIKQYESNSGRAFAMLDAYIKGDDWASVVEKLDIVSTFTKKDIIDFANRFYGKDYVVVYKKTGTDDNVVKVDKPTITPVEVNRDAQSSYLTNILAKQPKPIDPVFIDYKYDIARASLKSGVPVLYLGNKENQLFTQYYVFDMGRRNDKKLPFAIRYLQYLGTDKLSAQDLSKEFFKLGCEFGVSVSEDQVSVYLSGLDESYEAGVKLFEELLANVKPDRVALDNLVQQEMKDRTDAKLDKGTILWSGLRNYALYGRNNPFTDRLSADELASLRPEELTDYIKSLEGYKHTVLYYGPRSTSQVTTLLDAYHRTPATLKPLPPATTYQRKETAENVVYFVDHDMVQAEIVWLNKAEAFNPQTLPIASMFNEYFGGGMASVVFQTIRESKALAYSTFASYQVPSKKEDPFYVLGYVGTQADKINEAIPAMNELFTTMPKADRLFTTAKDALRSKLQTERIVRTGILFDYLEAQKLGVDHDLRRDVYAGIDKLTLDDVQRFHNSRFANKSYAYLVIGSKDRISKEDLQKYGKVVTLTLEDVFGY